MKIYLKKYLKDKGYKKIISNELYIIAEGVLPVCLCAHVDTVFNAPPTNIYYDKEQTTLWSPQGLGADDRAGIYIIIELLERGYRPSIILTDLEEQGGIGSNALTERFPHCPFKNCKALIQLDRKGKNEAVYYDCEVPEFEELITSYGFETDIGTFTDISILMPAWQIVGVNLSVGYLNEHNLIETLNLSHTYLTIDKVEKMLSDCHRWKKYKYIERVFNSLSFINYSNHCICCVKPFSNEEKVYEDETYHYKICENCYERYFKPDHLI